MQTFEGEFQPDFIAPDSPTFSGLYRQSAAVHFAIELLIYLVISIWETSLLSLLVRPPKNLVWAPFTFLYLLLVFSPSPESGRFLVTAWK